MDGWCSDGGGILKNREDIYRSLAPAKKRGKKKNTFQPEEFGFAVCYLSVG